MTTLAERIDSLMLFSYPDQGALKAEILAEVRELERKAATLPASGEAWYPEWEEVVKRCALNGDTFDRFTNDACIRATADLIRERGGQAGVLPPVAHDEAYGRDYIPLPGGWEIQTKGKGSTFRISDPKGERVAIPDERLHAPLTRLAHDIRAACESRELIARQPAAQAVVKESVNG